MKLQERLNNWGGVILNAITDEEIENIDLAISYEDHGDDFLYIRDKERNHYEYGYWLNRERTIRFHQFIKEPNLYCVEDINSQLSNRVFKIVNDGGLREWMDFCPRKYDDANWRLQSVINQIRSEIETAKERKIRYDFKHYLDDITMFIKLNELNEKEYKLDLDWDSRINGYDGEAGKKEIK